MLIDITVRCWTWAYMAYVGPGLYEPKEHEQAHDEPPINPEELFWTSGELSSRYNWGWWKGNEIEFRLWRRDAPVPEEPPVPLVTLDPEAAALAAYQAGQQFGALIAQGFFRAVKTPSDQGGS